MSKKYIQNWGNYPIIESEIIEPQNQSDLLEFVTKQNKIIARGNGRCYGDSALQNHIASTLRMNKFLFFDKENGIIKLESGTLLSEILNLIVPFGFFLPVTPGTKWITIGGAIASNIHGKNHHKEGSISNFVLSFDLMIENGETITCSKSLNTHLFIQTLGGMGLTGIITTVTLQLKPIQSSYIKQKSLKAKNLEEVLDFFEKYNDYTYSVAWIDCLKKGKSMGRSILMLGEHANLSELPSNIKEPLKPHSNKQINIPIYLPNFTLNSFTISVFNQLFYNKLLVKEKDNLVHYDAFFYPLDMLNNWNRIYGKNGFTQYQFVIPFKNGREGINKIMKEITESGCGSFLAVLKTFGKKDEMTSELSFPDEGYTLALDFKISQKVFDLLDRLDQIVLEFNGKLYLTKDVRMSKMLFSKTYPNFKLPSQKFSSHQIERLI